MITSPPDVAPREAMAARARIDSRGGDVGALVAEIAAASPGRATLALALMLVSGAVGSAGILMLAPLLMVVGIDLGDGSLRWIADSFAGLLLTLGIQPTLPAVLGAFITVITVRSLLQRWQAVAMARVVSAFVLSLRQRLYRSVLGARWLYFARARSSDVLHLLTEEMGRVGALTATVLATAASLLIGIVYLALAGMISLSTTLLAAACGGLLLAVQRREARVVRGLGEQLPRLTQRLHAVATDHLGGIRVLKAVGAEARSLAEFSRVSEDVARLNVAGARVVHRVRSGFEIGSVLLLALLVYAAVEVVSVSAAELLILILLFSRLVPRFSALQQSVMSILHSLPSFRALMEAIRQCEAEADDCGADSTEFRLRRAVTLAGVGFRYPGRSAGEPAVRDVDLAIPAGATVALVGPSGAGKSTVADLLMGLLTPDAGEMRIDDVAVTAGSVRSWRRHVGYVPQDPHLFHDSIRANLLMARPDATEEQCWEALDMAAAEFVRQLPERLDTVVGERGVQLSGGERQRIVLARALLRWPQLLILDEATSALDSEHEQRIRDAIENLHGRVTILVITHRLSTIRRADRIYVMEAGTIVESGSWDELVSRGMRFQALHRAQQLTGAEPRGVASVAG